jgi:YNFM family putative membrane transporter
LATLGGCALFFSFVGVFSFVTYYLEAPPFSLSSALGSLIFLLWSLGTVGPLAGAVADRIGWRATLVGALAGSLLALPLSLVGTLPAVVAALGVLTVAMFSGATAAQIGVATASDSDQGSASAIYYSCYYTCGAFAGYLFTKVVEEREPSTVYGLRPDLEITRNTSARCPFAPRSFVVLSDDG